MRIHSKTFTSAPKFKHSLKHSFFPTLLHPPPPHPSSFPFSVAGSEGERHPRHEGLSGVLGVGGRVGGEGRVCRQRGERGDGRAGSMGAVGQRRGVDVVVVHHWAGQHQLEQAGSGQTEKPSPFGFRRHSLRFSHQRWQKLKTTRSEKW